MSLFDRSPQGNIASPSGSSEIDIGTLAYANARLPPAFNGNAENALNYIFSVLYPKYIATVATPAALPVSASPNDYYIVADDGDGKSAGYVWIVRDNVGAFEKKYDVDWSYEGVYAETINRTQYMYVSKLGTTDKDSAGVDITGIYAGQKMYGGDAINQNLTFNANSFDNSGYVQTDNHFRPTTHNAIDLGTSALRFRTGYLQTSLVIDTLTLSAGSVSDSGGSISFGSNALTTTGNITAAISYATSRMEVGPLAGNALILAPGSITDESGAIDFGNENLSTTGTFQAATVTGTSSGVFGDITVATGSITATGGAISFNDENLVTTGTLGAGNTTVTRLDADNIRIDGNTVSVLNSNGNLILQANGSGVIDLQSAATTLGIVATGVVSVTGQLNADNLRLDGNVISSTNLNGNIVLTPNGSGKVQTSAVFEPASDNTLDQGETSLRFKDIYFAGSLSDGTTSIAQSVLQSLRDINVGVTTGMAIFWNGTKWVASLPDTEITHSTLSGLTTGDAGHTQFVMLAGRSGGQTVQGGTAASENLTLESTANASKGLILTKDVFAPFTNASFSGTWSGTDIGNSSHNFRDFYSKGEFFGLRAQNVSANPSNSAQNVGRVVWNTVDSKLYIDNGTSWVGAGSSVEKFSSDTSWNGSDTTKDVTVSSTITEARTALWQLLDNANDFERIYTSIKAISATQVRITVSPALPAGSYRLVGIN